MLNQKEKFSFEFIIDFIYKKKNILSIVFIFSVSLSIAVAYYITPLFKATSIIFPTPIGSVSKSILSSTGDKEDFLQMGDQEVVEQFLQILSSDIIRSKIISKYNLFQHYGIDMNSSYPYTKMKKKIEDYITYSKTRYLSIQIDVLDKDPKYAANITNDIVEYLDSVINQMQYQRAYLAFIEVEKKYKDLQKEIGEYEDSLAMIGEKGIVDYVSQSKSLTEAYSKALLIGNNSALRIIKQQIDTLAKYGPIYNSISNYLIFQREQLSLLRTKYIEAQVNAELKLPHKYIVMRAQVPERKSFPVRWLLVVVITTSSLILAIFLLLLFEKKKSNLN